MVWDKRCVTSTSLFQAPWTYLETKTFLENWKKRIEELEQMISSGPQSTCPQMILIVQMFTIFVRVPLSLFNMSDMYQDLALLESSITIYLKHSRNLSTL